MRETVVVDRPQTRTRYSTLSTAKGCVYKYMDHRRRRTVAYGTNKITRAGAAAATAVVQDPPGTTRRGGGGRIPRYSTRV